MHVTRLCQYHQYCVQRLPFSEVFETTIAYRASILTYMLHLFFLRIWHKGKLFIGM